MCGAIPPLPQYVVMAWCLAEHRDNFYFTESSIFFHNSENVSAMVPMLMLLVLYRVSV